MQIISKTRNLLILLAAGLCFPYLSIAMSNDTLDFYRTNMQVKKDKANDAADAVV